MPLNPFDATFEFSFERLVLPELQSLRDRLGVYAAEARLTHGFPLDMQQKEVKEMLGA